MLMPEEVEAMVDLYELGWGTKRIAAEFGCSRNTVKRYVATAGWVPYGSPRRAAALDGLEDWLKERFFRHRGNAEVERQDLSGERSIRGEQTHGRTRNGWVSAAAGGRGEGDAALRDAARASTADRFRRDAGTDSQANRPATTLLLTGSVLLLLGCEEHRSLKVSL